MIPKVRWLWLCSPYWKETYCAFFCFLFFSFLSVFYRFLCMSRILKVKKVCTNRSPLCNRKHCSWNSSSVVPAFISVTLWHHYVALSHICIIYAYWLIWQLKIDFSGAVLGLACVSWPIRGDWVLRRRTLKRQDLKQHIRERGNIVLQHWTACDKWCVFWGLKHVNLF